MASFYTLLMQNGIQGGSKSEPPGFLLYTSSDMTHCQNSVAGKLSIFLQKCDHKTSYHV